MPAKTQFVTDAFLRKITLPTYGGRYAVIPHGYIIDETKKQLTAAGFKILDEMYKTSVDGKLAQGIYRLDYGDDPDMSLMFAWSNSYNKMMRFKCAVGAQVFVCMNGVVSGDLGNYKRKHVGSTALKDAENHIASQISQAKEYYDTLVADKQTLKNVILTKSKQGAILGELFAAKEILTLTQVGIVKRELDKPTYTYNCDKDSAWAMYNHITFALKESHPINYLDDHQKVHTYFVDQFSPKYVLTELPLTEEPVKQEAVLEDNEHTYGVNLM